MGTFRHSRAFFTFVLVLIYLRLSGPHIPFIAPLGTDSFAGLVLIQRTAQNLRASIPSE